MVRKFTIDLNLNRGQLEQYYAGQVAYVWARDRNGVKIQFPLNLLRNFVDHNGVRGRFVLSVDDNNKCSGLEQINSSP